MIPARIHLLVAFAVCCCCVLRGTNSLAQLDSLGDQILRYTELKNNMIHNGRKMILDKLSEGDKTKVKELVDYLKTFAKDKDYLAFDPTETFLLYYLTGQFESTIDDVRNIEQILSKAEGKTVQATRAEDSLFFQKIKDKVLQDRGLINTDIHASGHSDLEHAFLILNLDYLLADTGNSDTVQQSLNESSNAFIQLFPNCEFEPYVRKYIRHQFTPSKWAFGIEFFTGYGVFTGTLGSNFTNTVPIGIAFDVAYKKFTLYLRNFIGLAYTREVIHVSTFQYENVRVGVFLPEASLGYRTYENSHLALSPFIGISALGVRPTQNDVDKYPGYMSVGLDFSTTWSVGANLDLKLGKTRGPVLFRNEVSYRLIRIRYAYNQPQFDEKYVGYSGGFHYLTIGYGVFARKLRRVY